MNQPQYHRWSPSFWRQIVVLIHVSILYLLSISFPVWTSMPLSIWCGGVLSCLVCCIFTSPALCKAEEISESQTWGIQAVTAVLEKRPRDQLCLSWYRALSYCGKSSLLWWEQVVLLGWTSSHSRRPLFTALMSCILLQRVLSAEISQTLLTAPCSPSDFGHFTFSARSNS